MKNAHDTTDADVEEVFSTFSKREKAAFLALWEGFRSLLTSHLSKQQLRVAQRQ